MKNERSYRDWHFGPTDHGIRLFLKLPGRVNYLVGQTEYSAIVHRRQKGFCKTLMAGEMVLVRGVKVDFTKTPSAMIAALHRREDVDSRALETISAQGEKEVDLFFFFSPNCLLRPEVAREFEARGLIAHPYAQMQANIDNPNLSRKFPNTIYWEQSENAHHASFFHRFQQGFVNVGYVGNGIKGGEWLAGVLNPATTKVKTRTQRS